MQPGSEDPRIETMHRGDRIWSIGAVAVLWLTYVFVFIEVMPAVADNGVILALVLMGGLVLLFNTASITALLSHYTADKRHIYGLDLHYLDEMRKTRQR